MAVACTDYPQLFSMPASPDLGLRGGTTRSDDHGVTLKKVRWSTDTTVTGRIRYDDAGAHGRLTITAPGRRPLVITVRWSEKRYGTATLVGVRLKVPAP